MSQIDVSYCEAQNSTAIYIDKDNTMVSSEIHYSYFKNNTPQGSTILQYQCLIQINQFSYSQNLIQTSVIAFLFPLKRFQIIYSTLIIQIMILIITTFLNQ